MKSIDSILRSLFISIFPFAALLILIYTVLIFLKNGFSWGILATLITSFTIVSLFAGFFIKPRARTDKYLKPYSIGIAIGLSLIIMAVVVQEKSVVYHISCLFLGMGWVLYLKWYSKFTNRENEILKIGKPLVDFELENVEKQKISSRSFLGNPSIFIFYRGNWCPLCMAQIKEVVAQYEALDQLGVNTVFISPQPHIQTKSLAEKYKLNFHFLVDCKNKVAKQLGVFAKNGIPAGFQVLGYDSDTVLPTVVITDKEGEIIFSDLTDNYRIRPEPELFLKIIRESFA